MIALVAAQKHKLRQRGAPGPNFVSRAAKAVKQLRVALRALLQSLLGEGWRIVDLQTELKLPVKAAWEYHSFVATNDRFGAVDQLPGNKGIKSFLSKVKKKNPPQHLAVAVSRAHQRFSKLVAEAGGRSRFLSMVGCEAEARREAFQGMSSLCGVQQAISIACYVIKPGEGPGWYDFLFFGGSVNLNTTHWDRSICINLRDNPRPYLDVREHPFPLRHAHPARAGGVPVVAECSSDCLPQFKSDQLIGLIERRINNLSPEEGMITYYLCEHFSIDLSIDPVIKLKETVLLPTKTLLFDILIAPGILPEGLALDIGVFFHAIDRVRGQCCNKDGVGVQRSAAPLGDGPFLLETSPATQYPRMVYDICKNMGMGWEHVEKFVAYRCMLEHPVLHSLVSMTIPLPASPSAPAPAPPANALLLTPSKSVQDQSGEERPEFLDGFI